MNELTDDLV